MLNLMLTMWTMTLDQRVIMSALLCRLHKMHLISTFTGTVDSFIFCCLNENKMFPNYWFHRGECMSFYSLKVLTNFKENVIGNFIFFIKNVWCTIILCFTIFQPWPFRTIKWYPIYPIYSDLIMFTFVSHTNKDRFLIF